VKKNFLLERNLLGSQPKRFIIEDKVVSFLPEAPRTNHKNLHEERLDEKPAWQ
jgi:hypothetical protein